MKQQIKNEGSRSSNSGNTNITLGLAGLKEDFLNLSTLKYIVF